MNNNDTLFQRFCSFDALYDSSYRICRNIRWKDSTINFEANRIENIFSLQERLNNNSYKQMAFSCFSIIERGKPRDIRACHICDRLLQNSLCEQVLLPEITAKFIYDNCATLKNKGIDFALQRTRKHLQAAHRKYGLGNDFYALRVDISKYFDSIDHQYLKSLIKKYIEDGKTQAIILYIIDTFAYKPTKDKIPCPNKTYYVRKGISDYIPYKIRTFNPNILYYEYANKSLGLGSQASQLLALLTLNEIDHFIKEQLRIKYYGRYMDDFYLLHNSKEYLEYCKHQIEIELNKIGLRMNPKKSVVITIHPVPSTKEHYPHQKTNKKQPFKYLKWNFYLTDTNKIIQLPFREKVRKQRRKMRKMQQLWLAKKISINDIIESYQGWRAHVSKGTTFYLIQDMDNYFYTLFKEAKLKKCFY